MVDHAQNQNCQILGLFHLFSPLCKAQNKTKTFMYQQSLLGPNCVLRFNFPSHLECWYIVKTFLLFCCQSLHTRKI